MRNVVAALSCCFIVYFSVAALPHHGHFYHRRAAEADPHGYFVECEKETKTVCKKAPVTEEVSKDFELCRPKPTKVCEDKELKVPNVVCEEPEEAAGKAVEEA